MWHTKHFNLNFVLIFPTIHNRHFGVPHKYSDRNTFISFITTTTTPAAQHHAQNAVHMEEELRGYDIRTLEWIFFSTQ
jgi:hypothetical protein